MIRFCVHSFEGMHKIVPKFLNINFKNKEHDAIYCFNLLLELTILIDKASCKPTNTELLEFSK